MTITTIENAFRMPFQVFRAAFLPAYRSHVFQTTAEFVRENVVEYTAKDMEESLVSHRKFGGNWDAWEHGDRRRLQLFFRKVVAASRSVFLSRLCLDAFIRVWIRDCNIYVVCHSQYAASEKFSLPAGVADYSYWDIGKQPRVSKREWEARKKAWSDVLGENMQESVMRHDIIRADAVDRVGLFEVATILLNGDKDKAKEVMLGV